MFYTNDVSDVFLESIFNLYDEKINIEVLQ